MTDIVKFEDYFEATLEKIKHDGYIIIDLKENIMNLKQNLVRIIHVAPFYSFANRQFNGFYSFTKLCTLFQMRIGSLIAQNRYDRINKDLLILSDFLCSMSTLILNLVKGSLRDFEPKLSIFNESPDVLIALLSLIPNEYKRALSLIFGEHCSFWLSQSMRRSFRAFVTFMAVYASSSVKNSFKCIFNRDYRGNVVSKIAHSANIYFQKSFSSTTEFSFINESITDVWARIPKPSLLIDFSIKNRQSKYKIVPNRNIITKVTDPEQEEIKEEIKCRLIFDRDEYLKSSFTAIIHCHGGAFVGHSPQSHEIYLREWATILHNIPIISIDYTLSPEGKFPKALQQVLDVYLWLVSRENRREIEDLLGFNPKHIILCGDSAGGNLIMATCLCLNDIKINFDENLHMPKSIVPIYAPFMLKCTPSPSRLFAVFDCFLPQGFLLNCLEAYMAYDYNPEETDSPVQSTAKSSPQRTTEKIEEETEEEEERLFQIAQLNLIYDKDKYDDEPPTYEFAFQQMIDVQVKDDDISFEFPNAFTSNFQKRYRSISDKIKKNFLGSYNEDKSNVINPSLNKKPWYLDDEEKVRKKIKMLNMKGSHPYVSPLMYYNFSTLVNIPIFLISAEFDVCLDDSIMMAKKWMGPTCLDVFDSLPHGFLNFIMYCKEAKEASDICAIRLRQAVEMK